MTTYDWGYKGKHKLNSYQKSLAKVRMCTKCGKRLPLLNIGKKHPWCRKKLNDPHGIK